MADQQPASIDQPSTNHQPMKRCALAAGLVVTLASIFTAAYFAGQASALRRTASEGPELSMPLPKLDATAAVTSEKFSMATGLVSDRAEGLFVLDHNSGLLQCSVMYPRQRQFLGQFSTNVQDALGTGKDAAFIMTTGLVDIPSSNNNPFASSVVYVLNTSTGQYACYAIPFNRVVMNAGRPQQGMLVLMGTGSADPVINRDALR